MNGTQMDSETSPWSSDTDETGPESFIGGGYLKQQGLHIMGGGYGPRGGGY